MNAQLCIWAAAELPHSSDVSDESGFGADIAGSLRIEAHTGLRRRTCDCYGEGDDAKKGRRHDRDIRISVILRMRQAFGHARPVHSAFAPNIDSK